MKDDLISRQAALDIVFDFAETPDKMYQQIRELPNIDPVKHGKWIKMSDADGVYLACSECGEDIPRALLKRNFCPNCGARMDGVKELKSSWHERCGVELLAHDECVKAIATAATAIYAERDEDAAN